MRIDVFTPKDCSEFDVYAFAALIKKGGRVNPEGLEKRICQAHKLAFCRIADEIISVAAVKRPYKKYINKVFQNASAGISPEPYTLEYGWVFTRVDYGNRGYASATASALLRNLVSPVFATTQGDNIAMQNILEKNRFEHVGSPYRGRENLLVLYVRGIWSPNDSL